MIWEYRICVPPLPVPAHPTHNKTPALWVREYTGTIFMVYDGRAVGVELRKYILRKGYKIGLERMGKSF